MSGRPVRLLAAATIATAASLLAINTASAGCYSGCGASYSYQAPIVYYTAPVVYSYSYAAPAAYAAPCNCGGYAAPAPMYVVNQGPSYAAPVTIEAEETYQGYGRPAPYYDGGYRRAAPYYAGGGVRWHRRHWHRGYGNIGHRYGYRGYAYRSYGYRGFGVQRHRYGAVVPGVRFGIRHPMVGPGGIYRGPRHAGGMKHGGGMYRMQGPRPGSVHPHTMGHGPKRKMP
jgi:hypothetical protein